MKQTIETYKNQHEKFIKIYENNTVERDQDDFLRLLDAIKGKKILDAGCGTGTHAQYFSQKGYEVTGIDLVDEFLEHARKRCSAEFIKMDLRKITFGPESFDGIWSCASLLHIPKHELMPVFENYRRILTDKGVVYTSVKKGTGENEENGRFFSYHTLDGLESFLQDAGFQSLIKYTEEKPTGNWVTIYSQKA
jgi:ubiquinone/menaquinone biosynthesis C-methylase UbiE